MKKKFFLVLILILLVAGIWWLYQSTKTSPVVAWEPSSFTTTYEEATLTQKECLDRALNAEVLAEWRADSEKKFFTKEELEILYVCLY